MRKQPRFFLAAVATMSLILAACQAGSSPSASPGESEPMSAEPTESAAPTEGPSSDLKIGVVTDVGTVDDKNFNQFSYEGAVQGAEAIGAEEPEVIVTQSESDYDRNIQTFIDQDFDVIVTVGFALGASTTAAAKANPDVNFIGVDQGICITPEGDNDPNFGCEGDPAELLPNYQGLVFAEQQPGYLAGIVAASISESGVIGAIGGAGFIPAVVKYARGYQNGAQSVNPDIEIHIAYISDDLAKAFNDPAGGKAFAEQFLSQHPDMDVLFQIAGKTGNGVLEAACAADINAIGVDVDQHESFPEAADCIVTSAEKKLSKAVSDAVGRINDGSAEGGVIELDASVESVGLSPYYEKEDLISDDTQAAIDDAFDQMADGSLDACAPNPCAVPDSGT